MFWAEEFLMNIQQVERPLEQYVEEFLSVFHLVGWSDAMINECFQMGLYDDKLFCSITPDDCRKPVAEFINHVLALCHSNYYVDVKDSNLSPIWEYAAAPAHHQPASSTCCSNELTPSSPPSLTPVLQSSSLILSPEPAVSSRTPAAARLQTPALASSRTPATPPRSGLPAAITHVDYFLLCLRWSRRALLCHRWSRPALPSLHWSRPFLQSAVQSLSFPQSALQSLSFLNFGGGCPPDPPWPPGLYARPWLPKPPDPPWPHGLCARPWLSELPDPPWPHRLCARPWLPELRYQPQPNQKY
ncbi:hypothetical protein M9458_044989, partial [Cirrhinus mrigala]